MNDIEKKLSGVASLADLLAQGLKKIEKMDKLTADERFELMCEFIKTCQTEMFLINEKPEVSENEQA